MSPLRTKHVSVDVKNGFADGMGMYWYSPSRATAPVLFQKFFLIRKGFLKPNTSVFGLSFFHITKILKSLFNHVVGVGVGGENHPFKKSAFFRGEG